MRKLKELLGIGQDRTPQMGNLIVMPETRKEIVHFIKGKGNVRTTVTTPGMLAEKGSVTTDQAKWISWE